MRKAKLLAFGILSFCCFLQNIQAQGVLSGASPSFFRPTAPSLELLLAKDKQPRAEILEQFRSSQVLLDSIDTFKNSLSDLRTMFESALFGSGSKKQESLVSSFEQATEPADFTSSYTKPGFQIKDPIFECLFGNDYTFEAAYKELERLEKYREERKQFSVRELILLEQLKHYFELNDYQFQQGNFQKLLSKKDVDIAIVPIWLIPAEVEPQQSSQGVVVDVMQKAFQELSEGLSKEELRIIIKTSFSENKAASFKMVKFVSNVLQNFAGKEMQLEERLLNLANKIELSPVTLLGSVVLVNRFLSMQPPFKIDEKSVYYLIVLAIRLSEKVLKKTESEIDLFASASEIPSNKLEEVEVQFAKSVGFCLYLCPKSLEAPWSLLCDSKLGQKGTWSDNYPPPSFPLLVSYDGKASAVTIFKFGPELGEGSFGTVWEVRKLTGLCENCKQIKGTRLCKQCCLTESYAFKRIGGKESKCLLPSATIAEVVFLSAFRGHPNIVEIKDLFLRPSDKTATLILEYCPGGDLHVRIKFFPIEFSQRRQLIKIYFKQLLSALSYMHSKEIVLRDIKPKNLFLTHEDVLKIGDFGFAAMRGQRVSPRYLAVITLWYRALELLHRPHVVEYGSEIDMWSAGCVLAEMALGNVLFQGRSEAEMILKIYEFFGLSKDESFAQKAERHKGENALIAVLGTDGADLLMKLLDRDPTKRISAEEALRHKFLNEKT